MEMLVPGKKHYISRMSSPWHVCTVFSCLLTYIFAGGGQAIFRHFYLSHDGTYRSQQVICLVQGLICPKVDLPKGRTVSVFVTALLWVSTWRGAILSLIGVH